jgi:hypothetical protein
MSDPMTDNSAPAPTPKKVWYPGYTNHFPGACHVCGNWVGTRTGRAHLLAYDPIRRCRPHGVFHNDCMLAWKAAIDEKVCT